MLLQVSDDELGHVCSRLDLLSGLGLASTAKGLLGQCRRLRLRGSADSAAKTIQRSFRRYYWPSALRQVLAEYPADGLAVYLQAEEAKTRILARFEGLDVSEEPAHVEAAFKQMTTFVKILHEVSAQTFKLQKQEERRPARVTCEELHADIVRTFPRFNANVLIDVLLEIGNEINELVNWSDVDINDGIDFYAYTFPRGDVETSLKCYFAQMGVWDGWCYRGNQMMNVIIDSGNLEQSALTFAGLHKWDCVDQEWHFLASSMYKNSESIEEEGQMSIMYQNAESIEPSSGSDVQLLCGDPDEMLARLSDPNLVRSSSARAMFREMRDERNTALTRGSTERAANELAMKAARAVIALPIRGSDV